jgi:hypothetical protein
MDESSKPQIKEVRQPIPVEPGEPKRYDFEYERNGVSNVFICFEPLRGWRHVEVTEQRTAIDWAHQIRDLVDIYSVFAFIALRRYSVLSLIMNNLSYRCCTLCNQKLLYYPKRTHHFGYG